MPFRRTVIDAAVLHLRDADPVLRTLIERVGPFQLKVERNRYALLVRSILSQQISTKAARSIRLKLEAQTNGLGLTPDAITALTDPQLRAVGLSGQKTAYLRDLTAHVLDGRLDLASIHRLDDEAAIESLIAVKGIGRWTAQMFLMFALARPDVFPHDDLGLRSSLKELYRLKDLPERTKSLRIAEPWRPYATFATWYCWRLSDLKTNPQMDASTYPV